MAYNELTVWDACRAVERFTGNSDPGAALLHVRAGYQRFLTGSQPDDPRAVHTWNFLQPLGTLAVTYQTSGFVSTGVYDADEETTTVTATAAAFATWMTGLTITVTDVGDLVIYSVTSTTVAVCTDGEDFAGKATSVPANGIYALPADYGGQIEVFQYPYDPTYATPVMEEVGPEDIMAWWAASNTPADPRLFAVVASVETGSTAQSHELWLAPRPQYDRTLRYRYRRRAPQIVDDKDCFFLGGADHAQTIKHLAIAEAELETGHVGGPREVRAQRELLAAITLDKRLFTSISVPSLRR